MRESLFSPAVLLVEGGTSAAVTALANRIGTALAISADDGVPDGNRSFVRLHLPSPTSDARRARWRVALGERARTLDGNIDALAAQFELTPGQIDAAIESAEEKTPQGLWQASRLQARPAFGELARRIEPSATWDDLVLPPAQTGVLKQIAMHVVSDSGSTRIGGLAQINAGSASLPSSPASAAPARRWPAKFSRPICSSICIEST